LHNNHSRRRQQFNLAPGSKDTATCREFFQDMRRRGLPDPLLVISDGAPGLFRAIEDDLPERRVAPDAAYALSFLG
jgi:transposase-like protein